MDDPRPNMRQLLNDDKDVDSLKRLAESRFEEEIVNYLFSRYNLPRTVRSRMLHNSKQETGRPALTLSAFNDEFPSFPIYLAAAKFDKVRDQNPVHKIWMDFPNRKFVKEFEKLKEHLPEGVTTYGLVFHWGFLRSKGRRKVDERASAMVLHNRESHLHVIGGFRGSGKLRRGGELLYLESLTTLLTVVDKESPEGKWIFDE